MGIEETIENFIQKQGGKIVQELLNDLKIKSFHGIKIHIGKTVIHPPVIRIKSDGFKIKVIDKSTPAGEAISDIPIPLDIKIKMNPIEINIDPIEIDPNIDMLLGNKAK